MGWRGLWEAGGGSLPAAGPRSGRWGPRSLHGKWLNKGPWASGKSASALGVCCLGFGAQGSQQCSLKISEPIPPSFAGSHFVPDVLYPVNASCHPQASPLRFHTSVPASSASLVFQKTLFLPSVIALSPYPSNTFLWLTLQFKHSPIKK